MDHSFRQWSLVASQFYTTESARVDLSAFWIWWGLTAMLCGGAILHGMVRSRELLGMPVHLSMMWMYFYVFLSFQAATQLEHLFVPDALAFAQFIACSSLASLLLGWYSFLRARQQRPGAGVSYDNDRLWNFGIFWLAVGTANIYLFRASGAQNMSEASGYLYMGYNVANSGAGLCAAVLARKRVSPGRIAVMAVLLFLLLGPSLVGARRGPTFAGSIAVLFGYLLARRSGARIWQVVGTLACVGVLMLFLVEARSYVYRGRDWNEAFDGVTLDAVVTRRSLDAMDNEFVNHYVQICANRETGLYQYGTIHLLMAVHWIPREFWPEKPQRSAGLFPEARDNFDPGFETNLGNGGAWGTAADAFDNYGYLYFVFWFVVGGLTATLFNRVRATDDLAPRMYYLGLLMSSHWFVAQSATEALVPAMFFQMAFWISLRGSRIRTCPTSQRKQLTLCPVLRPGV